MGKKILLLNHTRMGDLIQTTPLALGLKREYPDCKITALVDSGFIAVAEMMGGVDKVIPLDIRRFLPSGEGSETDLLEIYEYLDQLAKELEKVGFDILINLSHSKFSALLSLLIGAEDMRGYLSSSRGDRLITDPWLTYFSSFLKFRRYNRFNLVDIYMRAGGVTPDGSLRPSLRIPATAMVSVAEKMSQLGVVEEDTVVAIQAGASRADRRWPSSNFARVADHLVQTRKAKIILLGAGSEKKLGDEINSAMETSAIDLVGKTSVEELAGWLKSSNLLITNDTGTMHLATAVNTPITALFLAHARGEETGPYCDNATVMGADIECAPCPHSGQCDHLSCFSYITQEEVIAVCESRLDGKPVPERDGRLFARATVCSTRFHSDGGLDLTPVLKSQLTSEDLFAEIYRDLFITALSHWHNPEKMEAGRGIDYTIFLNRYTGGRSDLKNSIDSAIRGSAKISALALEGISVTSNAVPGIDVNKISDMENRIHATSIAHPSLLPMTEVYRRRVENFTGDNPAILSRQAKTAYLWLSHLSNLFSTAVKTSEKEVTRWCTILNKQETKETL